MSQDADTPLLASAFVTLAGLAFLGLAAWAALKAAWFGLAFFVAAAACTIVPLPARANTLSVRFRLCLTIGAIGLVTTLLAPVMVSP